MGPKKPAKRKRRGLLIFALVLVALFAGCGIITANLGSPSPKSQLDQRSGGSVSQAQVDAAKEVTERNLALLVKNPDSHAGKTVILYARITQFDSATGSCTFRADIGHKNMESPWDYGENSVFIGGDGDSNCPDLDGFVAEDEVRITATSLGSFSYDTQIGGRTTVPSFKVERIGAIE